MISFKFPKYMVSNCAHTVAATVTLGVSHLCIYATNKKCTDAIDTPLYRLIDLPLHIIVIYC
jgi:hypothetical protein